MAGSKMCVRPTQQVAEWTNLFQGDLKTEQKSLVFVKRMVALAVSNITYLRGIFPEDAYRSRYLEDQCVKILREDTPGPGKIVKWMIGSFDALERRYLELVSIGVYSNSGDPNCLIESYQFKFKYTDKGPQMDILKNKNVEMQVTMENTKKASVLLIRKLFLLMQNLGALPNDVALTMKLFYYDDVTPADYEPPGFKEGVCDSLWFEGMAVHFRVGEVQTPFHTMKVRVAAGENRSEKLREGMQVSVEGLSNLSELRETPDPHACVVNNEVLPSEELNESEEFKKPQRPASKDPHACVVNNEVLPSEELNESQEFKKPQRPARKRQVATITEPTKKRM